jgi:hypothetical protein
MTRANLGERGGHGVSGDRERRAVERQPAQLHGGQYGAQRAWVEARQQPRDDARAQRRDENPRNTRPGGVALGRELPLRRLLLGGRGELQEQGTLGGVCLSGSHLAVQPGGLLFVVPAIDAG